MFYDQLFYSLGLCITLSIAVSVNNTPNISGWYKISSVTDESYLTGSNVTKDSTTEPEEQSRNNGTFQIWSVVQQTNGHGMNYFILSGHNYTGFKEVSLITEGDGLYQRYHFEPVGRNLWTIYANGTDKCLTNNGIGLAVGLSDVGCLNSTNQLWILHNFFGSDSEDFSGFYYIQSPVNGKYITAKFNSDVRTIENHIRNDVTKKQEWRFIRRSEYGPCYEIRLQENRTQLIPTDNSTDHLPISRRLTILFELEQVGQARWNIKQLNSNNCLGFEGDNDNPELLITECLRYKEKKDSRDSKNENKQIWFLIKLLNPDNSIEGSRGCEALVGSANRREL